MSNALLKSMSSSNDTCRMLSESICTCLAFSGLLVRICVGNGFKCKYVQETAKSASGVKIRLANSLVCKMRKECLTLVLTHLRSHYRTNIGFSDFSIFDLKLEHSLPAQTNPSLAFG